MTSGWISSLLSRQIFFQNGRFHFRFPLNKIEGDQQIAPRQTAKKGGNTMITRELFPRASNSFSQLLAAATRPLRLLGLSVVLFGLLGSTMALHAAEEDPTGTWIIEVSFNGAACSPGDTVKFQCVYGLLTFHSDGTLSEVDTFASPAKQSWAPGMWQRIGDSNTFNTTFEQLQFSGAGSPAYYDVVWGPVTISGDTLTATEGHFYSYDFYNNLITNFLYSGTFTTVGKRMQLLTSQAPEPAP
jgi:hypothetical protein